MLAHTMLAHTVVAPSDLASAWVFEPGVVAAVATTGILYARGATWSRRAAAFYGGLAVVAVALLSPVDALGRSLFAGHMGQHLLLMVVAAPVLAYARPLKPLVDGLPEPLRHRVMPLKDRLPWHGLFHPVVVWTLGALTLWAWHMPALYEAALRNHVLHAVEHASFVGTALLFWSVVFASNAHERLSRPIAIVLVFASGVASTALGAVLLFASTALYPVHAAGTALWDVTPLEDQQLAGALMWGPPALLYLVTMAWLLVRWFADMDRVQAEPPLVPVGEHA